MTQRLDYTAIARDAIREIGYTHDDDVFHADKVLIMNAITQQSSDIAQILGITPRTVTFHLNNVVAKLGASSKCQAISWALKQGVVRLKVELASVANVDER